MDDPAGGPRGGQSTVGAQSAAFYPDVLDDLFLSALALASEYSDLTSEFDDFMGPKWKESLVGPDPGAQGRLNRAQRAASLGVQQALSCILP